MSRAVWTSRPGWVRSGGRRGGTPAAGRTPRDARVDRQRDWLHVRPAARLRPHLNPTEGVCSHVKRSLGNLAVTGLDHVQAIVKNRLRRIQYRPDLLDGFLAHTGLTLEPD
jgi:hypothetical protein